MKKVLRMGICGLMAAMLMTGCSSKEAEKTETTAAEAAVETTEAVQVVKAGEESVVLGEYKGLKYTPLSTEVTDEQVEAEMQALVDANPIVMEVERAAQEGDIVNIDYVGKKDDVAFDGGTASGYNLELGSGNFIDGFEDGLIGVSKGDTVSLNLTFPEDYFSEELAGADVVFEVTVNAVKESVPATLSDSFVAQFTDYTTVEEYRQGTRAEMEEYMQSMAENQKKNDVFLAVMNNAQVAVSEDDVNQYYEDQLAVYENQASAYGLDLETLVSYYGMDLESFKADLNEMAKEAVKQNYIIQAIADAEGITIEDGDREDLAAMFGYESVDVMIEATSEQIVDNYIRAEKVVEFLAENAVEE